MLPSRISRCPALSQIAYAILINEENQEWDITTHHLNEQDRPGRIRLYEGWATFVQENRLQAGMQCTLTFNNEYPTLPEVARFQVTIAR